MALLLGAVPAAALPPGRAWAPIDTVAHERPLAGARLEVDSLGRPWLAAALAAGGAGGGGLAAFRWDDRRFAAGPLLEAGGGPSPPEPVVATAPAPFVLWLSHHRDAGGWGRVLLARRAGETLGAPDTVMRALLQSSETAGAFDGRRFWVARSQQRFPDTTTFAVEVRRADLGTRPPRWVELPALGRDEFTCSIAPLPGGGALVVAAGESGLAWWEARGDRWVRGGVIDPRPWTAMHPRLALGPPAGPEAGTVWLLWTERERVHVSRYRGGRWQRGDSLVAAHPGGGTYWSTWCDASRERGERPVLAWGDRGFGATHRDVLCVSVPDERGWPAGEEVPGSEGAFIPTVARDRCGDVWVAWSPPGGTGVRIAHTYVDAVAESLRVTRRGGRDHVAWRLSHPAPGSRWTVLRENGEPAGAVRAGPGRSLSWEGRAGGGAYRVRRECVDERRVWISEPAASAPLP